MIALPHCHGETELNSYYSIAMENSGGSRHHKRVVPKKLTSPKGEYSVAQSANFWVTPTSGPISPPFLPSGMPWPIV